MMSHFDAGSRARGDLRRGFRCIWFTQKRRARSRQESHARQVSVGPCGAGRCNRECLYQFVDKYFEAMLSRCPCNLAFGPDAKYTENVRAVDPGEGMWKTFSGRGTYRVYLADPANQEAGDDGDITEDNGLLVGMIALRLKVKDHRITDSRPSPCASRSGRKAASE